MAVTYDLVIIGAGIHGAGVAQAASARGWSVLVVDKGEPASGTSSKSSKLIHGGLRYLETLQLKLVYECLRERRLLLRNAPDLVQLKPFYIPVYRRSRRGAVWVGLGLSLYAILGGLTRNSRFVRVPRRDWPQLNGLNTENLKCVYGYRDAQTDDAALTRAVLESAQTLGAQLLSHHQVTAITLEGDLYRVKLGGQGKTVRARALVNAAGPWVNNVAEMVEPAVPQLAIELVQGAHIVLDFPAPDGCFYLESPDDGRAVFALPWQGKIMVGTTETHCARQPEECQALDPEVVYLLRVFDRYFPAFKATESNIIATTAGLRVLPKARSHSMMTNKLSRETQLVTTDKKPAYLAVYGGKLTSYRSTAEKAANKLAPYLPRKPIVAKTESLMLVGKS